MYCLQLAWVYPLLLLAWLKTALFAFLYSLQDTTSTQQGSLTKMCKSFGGEQKNGFLTLHLLHGWHELGSPKKLKQQLVEGKGLASLEAAKYTAAVTAAVAMLTSLLCSPWKLGWSWRCRVLCIPRTSSDTRWATGTTRGALDSFISAVKSCLWNHDYCFYHFNSRTGWLWRAFVWRCHSELRFSWLLSEPLWALPGSEAGPQRRQEPCGGMAHLPAEPRRLWAGAMSLGFTTWTLLHLCESVAVMCREQNMGSEQTQRGRHPREIPAQQEGRKGADHLSREG